MNDVYNRNNILFSFTEKSRCAFLHHMNHVFSVCLNSIKSLEAVIGPFIHPAWHILLSFRKSTLSFSSSCFSPLTSPGAKVKNFNPKPSAYSAP